MRAAARARREAKEEQKLLEQQEKEQLKKGEPVSSGVDLTEDLEAKLAQGLKLTHKGCYSWEYFTY